jgi:hypothetical protein
VTAEIGSLGSHYAGRILAAVLQHQQPVIQQLVDLVPGDDPDYSAHRA